MDSTIVDLIKVTGKCCVTGMSMATSKSVTIVPLDYYAEWEFPTHNNDLFRDRKLAIAFIHDEAINHQTGSLKGDIKCAVELLDGRLVYHLIEGLKSCRDDAPLNPQVVLRRDCADLLTKAYHFVSKMNQYLDSNEKFIMYRDTTEHEKIKEICKLMDEYQISLVNQRLNENGNNR